MSFLTSLSNAFKSQQPAQQQGQGQNQQQNQGQGDQSGQGQPSAGNVPGNTNQQVNGSNTQTDPVALFNKMWDTPQNKQANTPPQLSLDSKVLDQVTGQLDFLQGAPQDLMQKAQQGDTAAMFELMQHVGRQAYRTSLSHNGALTNEFVGQRDAYSSKALPGMIQDHITRQSVRDGVGNTQPFVKQQVLDIADRIRQANPDASAAEINDSVKRYVKDLYTSLHGQEQSQQQSNSPAAMDWDSYADGNFNR